MKPMKQINYQQYQGLQLAPVSNPKYFKKIHAKFLSFQAAQTWNPKSKTFKQK